jgi:hypothetical protein
VASFDGIRVKRVVRLRGIKHPREKAVNVVERVAYLAYYQLRLLMGNPYYECAIQRQQIDYRFLSWTCGCKAVEMSPHRFFVALCIEHIDISAVKEGDEQTYQDLLINNRAHAAIGKHGVQLPGPLADYP